MLLVLTLTGCGVFSDDLSDARRFGADDGGSSSDAGTPIIDGQDAQVATQPDGYIDASATTTDGSVDARGSVIDAQIPIIDAPQAPIIDAPQAPTPDARATTPDAPQAPTPDARATTRDAHVATPDAHALPDAGASTADARAATPDAPSAPDGHAANLDAAPPQPDAFVDLCGNGVVDSGEQCDDGNTDNFDACNNSCQLPTIALISLESDDVQGNDNSTGAARAMSLGGRFVAFESSANNLAPSDNNGSLDVFVRDRSDGVTTLASVAPDGQAGNGPSRNASISNDGRFVAFDSIADDLVDQINGNNDANGSSDVFVRDRALQTTTLISVSSLGEQGDGASVNATISADGNFVVFTSASDNLTADRTFGVNSIFVHDLVTGQTQLVSVDHNGVANQSDADRAAISADGRYVAFATTADLGFGSSNQSNIYVRDTVLGVTQLVSVDSNGSQLDNGATNPAISGDGRFVVYETRSDNAAAGVGSNGQTNLFVYDLFQQRGTLVSAAAPDGVHMDPRQLANGDSTNATISTDGQYIAFQSVANNLIPGTSGQSQIYLADMINGVLTLVSTDRDGSEADQGSLLPALSVDGAAVAFASTADNLVAGDDNNAADVFATSNYPQLGVRLRPHGFFTTRTGGTVDVEVSLASQPTDDVVMTVAVPDSTRATVATLSLTFKVDNWNVPQIVTVTGVALPPNTPHELINTYLLTFTDVTSTDPNYNGLPETELMLSTDDDPIRTVDLDINGNVSTPGIGDLVGGVVSKDGRFVAFQSVTGNLVDNDNNGRVDVFVRDMRTGTTRRISLDSKGNESNGDSTSPSISDDGNLVAFVSNATNLTAVETASIDNVYVHNVSTGETTLLSVSPQGNVVDLPSREPVISGDGSTVAFTSSSDSLVDNDRNGLDDVFARNIVTGNTVLVSVPDEGQVTNAASDVPSISRDGRFVTFISSSQNFTPIDTEFANVYVRDLQNATTELVSFSSPGVPVHKDCVSAAISGDGNFVAFTSRADDLPVGNALPNIANLYLYSAATGSITFEDVSVDGATTDADIVNPTICSDGSVIAFASHASQLTATGSTGLDQIYVRNTVTNFNMLISVDPFGESGNEISYQPVISSDCSAIVFGSIADNLVGAQSSGEHVYLAPAPNLTAPPK